MGNVYQYVVRILSGRARRGGSRARPAAPADARRSSSSQMNGGPLYPKVLSERRHVVGGVGEAEHVVADEVTRGRVAELPVVVVGRDDRQLLDNEPV